MQRNRNSSETILAWFLLLTGVASSFTLIYPSSQSSFAHTFSGDESAAFLALIKEIQAQLNLVQNNLSSNVTLSQQYAQDAIEHLDVNATNELAERNKRVANDLTSELTELQNSLMTTPVPVETAIRDKVSNINDTLQESISARIEPDQLKNSTVKALALNDILGEILEHYAGAYGIEQAEEEEQNYKQNETSATPTPTTANETNANTTIVNIADYQSAQAFAGVAVEMLNEIKTLATSNASEPITELENGLTELKQAIDDKSPYDTVDGIVDSKIIPNLQVAFNFRLGSPSSE